MTTNRRTLLALTDHLAIAGQEQKVWTWQAWQIQRIEQGMNNRLFRARRNGEDYAVKFTIRDRRNRAGREWWALALLQKAGLTIAPEPVLLMQNRYEQPVVVQSWLAGTTSDQPSLTDSEWESMVQHVLSIHTLRPNHMGQRLLDHPVCRQGMGYIHALTWNRVLPGLRPVVLHITNAADAFAQIRWQMAQMPAAKQPPDLQRLVARVSRVAFPAWRPPRQTLCRADPNIRNFIQRPQGWASVDWEYSGWGDPAFEIADMLTHVAHVDVSEERWQWFVERYCAYSPDPGCSQRIAVYRMLMLVWWCVRLARYIYEIGHDLDQRLAAPSSDWATAKQHQYQTCLHRAESALTPWGG